MIRLFIADDHPIVREGLKRLIAQYSDLRVVGEASNRNEVLEHCRSSQVDVLIMDISMPGPGFLEVMRHLRQNQPTLPVLVLSIHAEELYAIRTLRAGAAGYLTKDQPPQELVKAIRTIHQGRKFVTPSLLSRYRHGHGEHSLETQGFVHRTADH